MRAANQRKIIAVANPHLLIPATDNAFGHIVKYVSYRIFAILRPSGKPQFLSMSQNCVALLYQFIKKQS